MSNVSKMRHPDHPELGIVRANLNEWARHRVDGWEFCNDIKPEEEAEVNRLAAELRGDDVPEVVVSEPEPKTPRKTKPRKDEDE